jgi:hypothetical protein
MNLRISNCNTRARKNGVAPYLHQCRQCGMLFEQSGKAASEFSWEKMFMVDKCNVCKNFGRKLFTKDG